MRFKGNEVDLYVNGQKVECAEVGAYANVDDRPFRYEDLVEAERKFCQRAADQFPDPWTGAADRRRSAAFEVGQVLDFPPGLLTMREERAVVVRADLSVRGHRVLLDRGQYARATLAFCTDCGLRVKDDEQAVREGPCDPIRAGDRFQSTTDLSVVLTALERSWVCWRLAVSGDRGTVLLLPSDVAGDVRGSNWVRLRRGALTKSERDATQAERESRATAVARAESAGRGYPDRSAVDALLREDARLHPEFAKARACAVMAYVEAVDRERDPEERRLKLYGDPRLHVGGVIYSCIEYEAARGGGTRPSPAGEELVAGWEGFRTQYALRAYEAARGAR